MRPFRLKAGILSIVALAAVSLGVVTSCQQEPEGERCDLNNGVSGGDSDCNDGLVCTAATLLGTETDRCCPADRSQATTVVCAVSTTAVQQDAAAPASDATTPADSATDSANDANDTGTDTGVADAADSG